MPPAIRPTPRKLVLISTEAAGGSYRERRVALFERFGGPEVGALARRRFLQPEAPLDQEAREAWRRLAMPVYTRIPRDPDMARRAISRPEVALHWFAKPGGESDTFNMFPELDRIRCPTLVIGGEDDPMHPIESQADHRCRPAAAPRAVRTVRRLRARRRARRA